MVPGGIAREPRGLVGRPAHDTCLVGRAGRAHRCRGARRPTAHGATLAEALRETGRFDDRLLHAVAVGEATGNTAEVLDRIAGEFDDESRRGFEAAARGVGFAVWAVVAGLIALVIFRIFSFYVGAIQEAVG